jgi:hypothetical protein
MSTVDATVVLDNRVNVSSTYTQLVPFAGQNVNYLEVPADGSSFPSQIYFNNIVTPGGLNSTLVNRNVRLRYTLTVTAPVGIGATTIGLPQNPYGASVAPTAALRAFPLQSVVDTLSAQVNGSTTTVNSKQILSATQRFIDKDYLSHQGLETPCMADNRALLVADQIAATAGAIIPVSNQPLSRYENSVGATRGSFLPTSYSINQAGNLATWIFDISEPLMVSPFVLWDNEVYLGQLSTMTIQLNYSSLVDMFVSSIAYTALSSITISNPRLQMTYIQIQPELSSIPKTLKYDYENIVYFPKTIAWEAGAGNAGTQQLQSDSLRLQTMPKMIYVFARNPIQNRAGQTAADCFYSLGLANGSAGVSLQLGTRTGLLASASSKTIFRMACANGYNSTYEDWAYGSGSVLAIDPVKNLGVNLSTDSVPGEVSGNVNLQIAVNVNTANFAYAGNLTAVPANIELMVVCVYGGDMTIDASTAVFNLGTLTQSEVDTLITKKAQSGAMVGSESVSQTMPRGSGLFAKGKTIVGHGQGKRY